MVEHVLVRRRGLAMARLPGVLQVWSLHEHWTAELNVTASLVFLLCDGYRSAGDTVDALCQLYPDNELAVRAEVSTVIADLKGRGLIQQQQLGPATLSSSPILKAAFFGFWPEFDSRCNYFLTMLGHSFDTMLVDPGIDDPDLAFCYASNPSGGHKIVPEHTKIVWVDLDEKTPEPMTCDYWFTTGIFQDSICGGKRFRLPIWAMFTDWTVYDRAAPYIHPDERLPSPFHPETACRHLTEALGLEGGGPEHAGGAGDHRGQASARRSPSLGRVGLDCYQNPPTGAKRPKLTVGMATHNDFHGVYFTVQALQMYHGDCLADIEIVIVDNDPDGPDGSAVRNFAHSVDHCRYVPFADFTGTCVKDLVFRTAQSDAVLCIDSHVMLFPGAVRQLIEFFEAHPECNDLLQGPLFNDRLCLRGTHWDGQWQNGEWFNWAVDQRGASPDNPPFEIDAQGSGVFACRKEAWPGFSPRFTGFGWEEGYIHEKFRQAGRRTLCLPFLRWIHRFTADPKRVTYPNSWDDRIRNVIIGHSELGLDATPVTEYFRGLLGPRLFPRIAEAIDDEMSSPFFEFEVAYCLDSEGDALAWEDAREHLRRLGVHRPRRFVGIDPTRPSTSNRVLAHRAIIEFAQYAQLQSVIVFENVLALPVAARQAVAAGVERLRHTTWAMFAIAGAENGAPPGVHRSETSGDLTAGETCAIAYHRRAFQGVLERLPSAADHRVGTETETLESHLRGIGGEFVVCRWPADLGP